MKKIKFIISFVLILTAFILTNEMYTDYLNSFYAMESEAEIKTDGIHDNDSLFSDISVLAEKHNIYAYTINTEPYSANDIKRTVYSTDSGISSFSKDYAIKEKTYRSIFSGDTQVVFSDFRSFDALAKTDFHLYLKGSLYDINKFSEELSEFCNLKYYKGYKSIQSEKVTAITVLWSAVFAIIVLMTVYDSTEQRKESAVRLFFGRRVSSIVAKNVLLDVLFYILSFGICSAATFLFTGSLFAYKRIILIFILFIAVNSAIYIRLFLSDYKKDLSGIKSSEKLLCANYLIKFITTTLTVLFIASNAAVISECISYYNQKDFFDQRKDYYFINIKNKNRDDPRIVTDLSYRVFSDKLGLQMCDPCFSLGDADVDAIFTNANMYDYYCEAIEGFSDFTLTAPAYIIVPENNGLSSNDIDDLKSRASNYIKDSSAEIPVLTYSGKTKIITVDKSLPNNSAFVSDPILVYINDTSCEMIEYGESSNYLYFRPNNAMIKKNDAVLEAFKNPTTSYELTNVYDSYLYNLKIMERSLAANVFLSAFAIILNILISLTILKFEYEVNAKELAIKKVLGYSSFSKLKLLYMISVIVGIISMTVSAIVIYKLQIGSTILAVISCLVFMAFEIAFITRSVGRKESKQICKILKGGSL